MSDELKPCKRCGGKATCVIVDSEHEYDWDWFIQCKECHERTDAYSYIDNAIAAWNRRADDAGELPTDDACAILRKNLHGVGDLGRAMGILEPNELVGGSGDRAYIFECLADLIERDYVRRDSIADEPTCKAKQVVDKQVESTANDNLSAETDISADGHARNDTETMDSRERLEADALDYVVRTAKLCHGLGLRRELWQFNPEPLLMHIRQCLDRQAAITSRECETEFLDRAEVIITRRELKQRELQEQVDSLTAELCGERKSREYAYNELNKMLALDGKRVKQINELTAERDEWKSECSELTDKIGEITNEASELMKKQPYTFDVHDVPGSLQTVGRYIDELTAERDHLSRDLEAEHALAMQLQDDTDRLRDELAECDEQRIEYRDQRDELQSIIDHMPKTEAECEACQEAHDRLMYNAKVHQDELREQLADKQHVCDVQRDSFAKMERENAELRRMLADVAEAI